MKKLTPIEQIIFNEGERLIPGVTHDLAEVIRHKSSYLFFKKVIESDLAILEKGARPIQIVDLGCGVGYGCHMLSDIAGVKILGVDRSPESLEYARRHYSRANITYEVGDLIEFIPTMSEFDYVVSRGVFEHMPDGLRLALSTKWRNRLLFDVPYDESEGKNPYHMLYKIREETFSGFPGVKLFFQDLNGVIYDMKSKPPLPNMILCVCSHPEFPKGRDSQIAFPFQPLQPKQNFSFRNVNLLRMIQGLRSLLKRQMNRLARGSK